MKRFFLLLIIISSASMLFSCKKPPVEKGLVSFSYNSTFEMIKDDGMFREGEYTLVMKIQPKNVWYIPVDLMFIPGENKPDPPLLLDSNINQVGILGTTDLNWKDGKSGVSTAENEIIPGALIPAAHSEVLTSTAITTLTVRLKSGKDTTIKAIEVKPGKVTEITFKGVITQFGGIPAGAVIDTYLYKFFKIAATADGKNWTNILNFPEAQIASGVITPSNYPKFEWIGPEAKFMPLRPNKKNN